MLGGSFLREEKGFTKQIVVFWQWKFASPSKKIEYFRVSWFSSWGMIHINAFAVWALSFPKLNCSSLIIKLKLKVLLFKAKFVIEKRFSIKNLNFLSSEIFFIKGPIFFPKLQKVPLPPPLQGGRESGQNIHPWKKVINFFFHKTVGVMRHFVLRFHLHHSSKACWNCQFKWVLKCIFCREG